MPEPKPTGAPPPGRVAIVDSDGSVSTVATHEVDAAMREGARVASPDELRKAQLEAQYGGTKGEAKAFAAGGARGLTLGLSDAAAVAIGGESTRRELAGLEEANPTASLAGDIAGSAAPVLLSGGESLAARGLASVGAAPRVAASVGRLAERGVVAALGEGTSVGGRIARSLAGHAASGAAEASLYGAGQAVTESALGDSDLTAEQLMAHMSDAATFGGLLGGVSGAPFTLGAEGARAVSKGAGKLRDVLQGARPKVADALAGFAGRGRTAAEGLVADAATAGKGVLDEAPAFLQRLDERASAMLPDSNALMKLSDENAWRSTYARKKFTAEADARAGGADKVGRVLKETGVIRVEDGTLGNALSPEDLLPRIEEAKGRVGKELGAVVENSAAVVKAGDIIKGVDDVIAPLREIAGRENVVASLEGYRNSLAEHLGAIDKEGAFVLEHPVSVQDLRKQRIGLQDIAYAEAKSLDPAARVEFLRTIRGTLDDIEVGALVAEGADAGAIARMKRQYQGLRIAEDATRDSITRLGANRSVGATDYLAFIGGGGGITGAGLALVNKVARERGSAAASVLLEDLAKTRSIAASTRKLGGEVGQKLGALNAQTKATERAAYALNAIAQATEQTRNEIRGGVRAFIEGAKGKSVDTGKKLIEGAAQMHVAANRLGRDVSKTVKTARETRQSIYDNLYMTVEGYEHRRRDVEAFDAAPGLLATHLQTKVGGLGDYAPQVATALATRAAAHQEALRKRLPPTHIPAGLFPFAVQAKPKRLGADQARFMRFAYAIDHPKSVIADLHNGTLSPEAVDAIKEGWPSLYSDIRQEAFTAINEHQKDGNPMPFDKELSLSLLLDVPTNFTRPEFVAAVQATKPPPDENGQTSETMGNDRKAPSRLDMQTFKTKGEEIEHG